MGELYKRLSALCEEKNITAYKMCKDVGMQPSVMTDLKMGRRNSVKADTADRLAEYFNVTVGYLLGNSDEKTRADTVPDILDEVDVAFFGDYKVLNDNDKEAVRDLVRVMRERREKRNPK